MTHQINPTLDNRPSDLSIDIALARRRLQLINEAAKMIASRSSMPKTQETRALIRATLKEQSDPGKKMMKIGTALVMMPEPVTSAAGVPLILVGKTLSSRKGTTVAGVYEELRLTFNSLSSMSNA